MRTHHHLHLLLALFVASFLNGCAGITGAGDSQEVLLSYETHQVSFTVPAGWKLEPQLHRNGRSMKLKGNWQPATLSLSFSKIPVKNAWASEYDMGQDSFSEAYTEDMRRRGYTNLGLCVDGHHTIPDGREIMLFVEASNQIYLVAFVPSGGTFVHLGLHGDVEDIVRHRQDFYKLLDSCRFEQQSR